MAHRSSQPPRRDPSTDPRSHPSTGERAARGISSSPYDNTTVGGQPAGERSGRVQKPKTLGQTTARIPIVGNATWPTPDHQGSPSRPPAHQPSQDASITAAHDVALVSARLALHTTLTAAELPMSAPPVVIRGNGRAATAAGYVVPRRHGSRSFVARFVASMVMTAVLLSAVALSTPLGRSASLTPGFAAIAGQPVTLPTPTPTPAPTATPNPGLGPGHVPSPGQQAIISEIEAVFGQYAQGALNIARCESGYDPNAWNPYPIMGSHASGVFQILYPITWNSTSYAGSSPYDADANIHAAYQLFSRDGYTWSEWACKP